MVKVELEQIINPGKASPEKGEETTALVTINTEGLNQESLEILNQLIAAEEANKQKDLTYLFNVNQNKKAMVRIDHLNTLQDNLVGLLHKRVTERPDEMSNQEVMQAIKIVQDIIDRSNKQVNGPADAPLIQINQQTNNIGDEPTKGLKRESRDRVRNVINNLLHDINNAVDSEDVVDFTAEETKDD